jgi:hypothetical protein
MRTASKCWFVAGLALASLVLKADICAQENAIDIKSPVCKIISLPHLLGEVALSLGEKDVIEKIMPCLLKLWEEQIPNVGRADMNLSNSFLFVMEENPQAFVSIMATQPKVFSDWLSELPRLSFTSPSSRVCALQTKRKQLIQLLQNANVLKTKEQALRKSLIGKLSQMPDNKNCAE